MIINGPNEACVPIEKSISLLSSRYKVVQKIYVNRDEGYYVFRGFDTSVLPEITATNDVIIFLQILRKAELNPRFSLPRFCEEFRVDQRSDFIYRGKSNCFYYICVMKYSDELLKFI